MHLCMLLLFLKILFIYFREREREGEREGEKHQCVVASHVPPPPMGTQPHNPGMCSDWESNLQPSGLQPVLNPVSYTSQGYSAILTGS